MPNKSRQKGDRVERAVVELLRAHGLEAYRIPLSGAVDGFKSDIEVRLPTGTLTLESKCRAKGFSRLYKWLMGSDAVVIKADHQNPLIVLDLNRFVALLAGSPHNQPATDTSEPNPVDPPPSQPPEPQPESTLGDLHTKPSVVYFQGGKPTIKT